MVWYSHKLNTFPVSPSTFKGHQPDTLDLCAPAMPSQSPGAVTQNQSLHSASWTKSTIATEPLLLGYSQVTEPRLGEAKV